jgi:glycosyltransferase involved in cell wall biosynthesis
VPRLSLSVIIPAYNEESSIAACLASLEPQLDDIDEIIVVDNNSTDATPSIIAAAQSRMPQLRVVREAKPGIIPVRNTAFDAASGEIVARLDADAVAGPLWAAQIRHFFEVTGETYAAGFGSFGQYDMPLQAVHNFFLSSMARKVVDKDGVRFRDYPTLMGANMFIRKEAWAAVRTVVSERRDILEDLDLAFTLRKHGLRTAFVPDIRVEVSGRRLLTSPRSYWKFTSQVPRTVRMHYGVGGNYLGAQMSVAFTRVMHLALLLPGRAYDPASRTFSVSRIFAPLQERPIPDGSDRSTAASSDGE